MRPVRVYSTFVLVFKTTAYVGHAEVTYVGLLHFCIMLIFCWTFLVGLLHDFQILHIDAQIFKLGSHDVLKIQVY